MTVLTFRHFHVGSIEKPGAGNRQRDASRSSSSSSEWTPAHATLGAVLRLYTAIKCEMHLFSRSFTSVFPKLSRLLRLYLFLSLSFSRDPLLSFPFCDDNKTTINSLWYSLSLGSYTVYMTYIISFDHWETTCLCSYFKTNTSWKKFPCARIGCSSFQNNTWLFCRKRYRKKRQHNRSNFRQQRKPA